MEEKFYIASLKEYLGRESTQCGLCSAKLSSDDRIYVDSQFDDADVFCGLEFLLRRKSAQIDREMSKSR